MSKHRILVVDDDVQIRRALRQALAARGYDVLLAASGEEAVDAAVAGQPHMVILDLALPGMSGLDVCRKLRADSDMPILVLSVRERPEDKVGALDLGADDYLTKPFDTGELLARIRSHLRRAAGLNIVEAVFEQEELRVDFGRRTVERQGEEVHLTRTEFSLLQYLVQSRGRVVTYQLLLDHVWGDADEGDVQTLRVHIGNLRRKIEVNPDRPRMILTEAGVGYRFVARDFGRPNVHS